jgi:hypothetical protein
MDDKALLQLAAMPSTKNEGIGRAAISKIGLTPNERF